MSRAAVVLATLAVFATAIPLNSLVGRDWIPADDQSELTQYMNQPVGTSVEGNARVLTEIAEKIASAFPKVAGQVIGLERERILVDIGGKDAVIPGLELQVYREGQEFKHPYTGQILGTWQHYTIPVASNDLAAVKDFFKATLIFKGTGGPGGGGVIYFDNILYQP